MHFGVLYQIYAFWSTLPDICIFWHFSRNLYFWHFTRYLYFLALYQIFVFFSTLPDIWIFFALYQISAFFFTLPDICSCFMTVLNICSGFLLLNQIAVVSFLTKYLQFYFFTMVSVGLSLTFFKSLTTTQGTV